MSLFDEILVRGEAAPVYVVVWDYKSHVVANPLGPNDTELVAAAGTFNGWPSTGYAEFEDTREIVAWSGIAPDGSVLKNLRRGLHRSAATTHAAGAELQEYGFWRPLISRRHPAWPMALACLLPPQLGAVSLDPRKGSASLSATRLSFVESPHPEEPAAAYFADLLAHAVAGRGNGLRGRGVSVYLGFMELSDQAEFRLITRGNCEGVHIEAQGSRIELAVKPLHGSLKGRRLFIERVTHLGNTATPTDTVLQVADETQLQEPATGMRFVRIDDEIISYAGVAAGELNGVVRGLFNSQPAAHEVDSEVRQIYFLSPENPLTLLLQILTSTGEGTNGPYDVLDKSEGLAIESSLVDIAAVEQLRNDFVSQGRVVFLIDEEVNDAKKWIERQLLAVAGCSLLLNDTGTISASFYGPALPEVEEQVLTNEELVRGVGLEADVGLSQVVNVVEVRYSPEPVNGKFLSRRLLIDNDSILAHGETPKIVMEFSGLHGQFSVVNPHTLGDIQAGLIAQRIVSRYKLPRKSLNWQAPLTRARLPVGGIVEVLEDRLPSVLFNESSGRHTCKGSNGTLYEVVSRRVDYGRGRAVLGLLETEFSGQRYLFIHVDGAPDYENANDVDKRLGYFVADESTMPALNDNPIPFPDGGQAYLIYPA